MGQGAAWTWGCMGQGAAWDRGLHGTGGCMDMGLHGTGGCMGQGAAWDRGLHGQGAEWTWGCMGQGAAWDRGLHGTGAAWDRGLHGQGAEWTWGCMGQGLHGTGGCMDRGLHGTGGCMGQGAAWDRGRKEHQEVLVIFPVPSPPERTFLLKDVFLQQRFLRPPNALQIPPPCFEPPLCFRYRPCGLVSVFDLPLVFSAFIRVCFRGLVASEERPSALKRPGEPEHTLPAAALTFLGMARFPRARHVAAVTPAKQRVRRLCVKILELRANSQETLQRQHVIRNTSSCRYTQQEGSDAERAGQRERRTRSGGKSREKRLGDGEVEGGKIRKTLGAEDALSGAEDKTRDWKWCLHYGHFEYTQYVLRICEGGGSEGVLETWQDVCSVMKRCSE
ncbi:hypothetical protein NQZ68_042264 [Dissostichus eleginoides]|nr:hypothetical protein NQZ68_042264 [Dissostichus eleginoides]